MCVTLLDDAAHAGLSFLFNMLYNHVHAHADELKDVYVSISFRPWSIFQLFAESSEPTLKSHNSSSYFLQGGSAAAYCS